MPEEVTEEEAESALQQLLHTDTGESEVQEIPPLPLEPSVEEKPTETEVAAAETPEVEVAPDDLESLQSRLTKMESDAEESQKDFDARFQALQERNNQREQVHSQRYLRKSTAADNALKVLRSTRSEEGAAEAEVTKVIGELEGTMNQASASYVAPTPQSFGATEDQLFEASGFMNEKQMTRAEEDEFGAWSLPW